MFFKLRLKYIPRTVGISLIFALMIFNLTGCGLLRRDQSESSISKPVNPALLKRELRLYMSSSHARIVSVATEVASAARDRAIREKALRLKIRSEETRQAIQYEQDPRVAFLKAWSFAVELRIYLTEGEGRDHFGSQQDRVVEVAQKLEDDIVALGKKHFPPRTIEKAYDDIENFVTSTDLSVTAPSFFEGAVVDDLRAVLRIPLLPMSALEGVTSSPEAIGRFTRTTENLIDTLRHIPERSRWELQMLLLEMETDGAVAEALKQVRELRMELRTLVQTVENVAPAARVEAEALLEAVEQAQPSWLTTATLSMQKFHKAVGDARSGIAESEKMLAEIPEAGASLQEMARSWNETAETIRKLLADYHALQPTEKTDVEKTELSDYAELADKVQASIIEMRALLAELRSAEQDSTMTESLQSAAVRIINTAFRRAIALVVIIFMAAFAWAWLRRRFLS